MTTGGRRVALVSSAGGCVGPALSLALALAGHDLVVHQPRAALVDGRNSLQTAHFFSFSGGWQAR